jgi:ABC-2 type transport system permease protein
VGFLQRLRDGRPVQVQALVDGTDDNTANVLIGYAQAVVQGYSSEFNSTGCAAHGQSPSPPVSVETRTWYNEDLESSAFIVPGVLALVMSVIGAFLTSLTIAREWERGTMEQLISTPVTPDGDHAGQAGALFRPRHVRRHRLRPHRHLLVSRSFPRFFSNSAGQFRHVHGGRAFARILYLRDRKESVCCQPDRAARHISSSFPALRISLAIEQMPVVLQWITRILPARYYVSVLKKIFLKGTPTPLLYPDLIPLAVFTVVLALLATRAFHKRLV